MYDWMRQHRSVRGLPALRTILRLGSLFLLLLLGWGSSPTLGSPDSPTAVQIQVAVFQDGKFSGTRPCTIRLEPPAGDGAEALTHYHLKSGWGDAAAGRLMAQLRLAGWTASAILGRAWPLGDVWVECETGSAEADLAAAVALALVAAGRQVAVPDDVVVAGALAPDGTLLPAPDPASLVEAMRSRGAADRVFLSKLGQAPDAAGGRVTFVSHLREIVQAVPELAGNETASRPSAVTRLQEVEVPEKALELLRQEGGALMKRLAETPPDASSQDNPWARHLGLEAAGWLEIARAAQAEGLDFAAWDAASQAAAAEAARQRMAGRVPATSSPEAQGQAEAVLARLDDAQKKRDRATSDVPQGLWNAVVSSISDRHRSRLVHALALARADQDLPGAPSRSDAAVRIEIALASAERWPEEEQILGRMASLVHGKRKPPAAGMPERLATEMAATYFAAARRFASLFEDRASLLSPDLLQRADLVFEANFIRTRFPQWSRRLEAAKTLQPRNGAPLEHVGWQAGAAYGLAGPRPPELSAPSPLSDPIAQGFEWPARLAALSRLEHALFGAGLPGRPGEAWLQATRESALAHLTWAKAKGVDPLILRLALEAAFVPAAPPAANERTIRSQLETLWRGCLMANLAVQLLEPLPSQPVVRRAVAVRHAQPAPHQASPPPPSPTADPPPPAADPSPPAQAPPPPPSSPSLPHLPPGYAYIEVPPPSRTPARYRTPEGIEVRRAVPVRQR